MFDRLLDKLYNKITVHELKILEDYSDLNANLVSDDVVEGTEDTMTLVNNYVDQLPVDLDKDKLKNMIKETFLEAQDTDIPTNDIFKKVRYKNFLSTGQQFIEVQLDRSSKTLVVGENGAGKSTMLDALCFGLFQRAFRNIKKDQMVNSINEKDCVVEVEFIIGQE